MPLFGKDKASVPSTSLGIDIGSRSVKAMAVERNAGRVDIQAVGSFFVEDDWCRNGVLVEPKRYSKALAKQLEPWNLVAPQAIVSVPSNLAVLRWVNLPPLKGDDLRSAARYKVKRHLPFPVESAYVEATEPDGSDEDGNGQSLVIAVPRDIINSRAEALEGAGVTPIGAELEAQAILRVVERRLNEQSALWRDASLTIIDVGANNTHMYVVQNQRLQFIRGVKFGARRFAIAVANEFNCTIDEADAMIGQPDTELGADGMLKLKLGDLPAKVNVQAEVDKLTREFLRLLRYFRSLHPERSYAGILDHVLVCGGLSGTLGLPEYLQEVLGLRVERARPFSGMVGKFNQDSFGAIASRQEAYTVVMGLALSGLREHSQTKGENRARREFTWARSA